MLETITTKKSGTAIEYVGRTAKAIVNEMSEGTRGDGGDLYWKFEQPLAKMIKLKESAMKIKT